MTGDDVEQRRFGDWLDHDERYARTGEFLHVVDSVGRGDGLNFKGDYYTVADAGVSAPPDPLPQIYFGGSSPAAMPIAAQYVDGYLTWGEPSSSPNSAKTRSRSRLRCMRVRSPKVSAA